MLIITTNGLRTNFNSVNDADNGCINRAVFAAKSHARGTALHYQDDLSDARAHRVYRNNMAFFVLAVHINKPRDQQLAPGQAVIFSRGNYSPDYSS
jgi:hypothetical protein